MQSLVDLEYSHIAQGPYAAAFFKDQSIDRTPFIELQVFLQEGFDIFNVRMMVLVQVSGVMKVLTEKVH